MKKILFFGDSIVCGVGASSPEERFSTLCVKIMNKDRSEYCEINLGVSGSKLVDFGFEQVLPNAIKEKPDVFVIEYGTNDNALGVPEEVFLQTYLKTVQIIKEKLPETQITCMTICPSWDHYDCDAAWLEVVNPRIIKIAEKEKTLLAKIHIGLGNNRKYFPDGIHPNNNGHRIIAEILAETIQN